jgi:glycine cleavage system transcriptional repressor
MAEPASESAIVLATGADRPGVLDELSQFLLEIGANIVDIRSINLHGQFALLLLVTAPRDTFESMRAGLAKLAGAGISAELRPALVAAGSAEASTFPYVFTATGRDQAGVLHRISHLLRALKINITDVQTHVSGKEPFRLRLTLEVPRETPISMVRDYLTYLCNELSIAGELKEA